MIQERLSKETPEQKPTRLLSVRIRTENSIMDKTAEARISRLTQIIQVSQSSRQIHKKNFKSAINIFGDVSFYLQTCLKGIQSNVFSLFEFYQEIQSFCTSVLEQNGSYGHTQ